MDSKNKKLPKNIVNQWPEILQDVEFNSIPISYLHKVRITFQNGTIWDIDIEKSKIDSDANNIQTSLLNLFTEYQDTIEHIDFRLDTLKLKEDILKKTSSFLNENK